MLGIADDDLVRGDEHGELLVGVALAAQELAAHLRALLLRPVVDDGVHAGCPLRELVLPVVQRRERADDHEGPGHVVLLQVREQRDGLHRLAQPHLVAQDPVEAVLIEADQPVNAHLKARGRGRDDLVWRTGSVQLFSGEAGRTS